MNIQMRDEALKKLAARGFRSEEHSMDEIGRRIIDDDQMPADAARAWAKRVHAAGPPQETTSKERWLDSVGAGAALGLPVAVGAASRPQNLGLRARLARGAKFGLGVGAVSALLARPLIGVLDRERVEWDTRVRNQMVPKARRVLQDDAYAEHVGKNRMQSLRADRVRAAQRDDLDEVMHEYLSRELDQ